MILSAVLKRAGHDCDVLIPTRGVSPEKEILRAKSDLIGFHCVSGAQGWIGDLLRTIPERPPVVLGGTHPTFVPEVIREIPVEYIIRGEAEGALTELMDSLDSSVERRSSIKNLWMLHEGTLFSNEQRNFIDPLDDLPFQDAAIYFRYPYMKEYIRELYPVVTSRGCPHNCTYCFNKKYRELHSGKGRFERRRSPENVVEELKAAIRFHGIRKFIFEDDSFITGRDWLADFSELYIKRVSRPFMCQTTATSLNRETTALLKNAGCISVKIGVETAVEEHRRKLLGKNVSDSQIAEAARLLRELGIMLQTYNMIGIPGEDVDQGIEILKFNVKIGAAFVWTSFFHAYPGTEIHEKLSKTRALPVSMPECDSFFVPNRDTEKERCLVNLGMLMQFFASTRLPIPIVLLLIRLPLSLFYKIIQKVFYGISIRKINRIDWLTFLRISIRARRYY
jgi:radical SAM superfamily enzyme YgiQ (UPF0313 family)